MAKRLFGAPLKNITNVTGRQASKGTSVDNNDRLSSSDMIVLAAHQKAEKSEICSMSKYSKQIMEYYDKNDIVFTFQEKNITFEMRSLLVDWLVSCCEKLSLSDDTFYLCVYFVDRFLSGRDISTDKLQLVGITALVIAAKYEEVVCPDLSSFILLSDRSFSEGEIKKAEKYMLYMLDYRLDYVNPLFFLRRAAKANNYEARSRKMAKYFMELMNLHREFQCYKKNILGTTAMYLARKICQSDQNKGLLFYYTNIDRNEIRSCFDSLVKIIYKSAEYENVEIKYANPAMFEVNLIARAYAEKNFN